MSQKSRTVYVHMGPICNGCWVWSSWSVAAHFTDNVVNNISSSHLWDRDNPHGTVESNCQQSFCVNVWCGVIVDQLIGPYIFLKCLTGDIYANILQDDLPGLLENFLYKHDDRCTTNMTERSLIVVRSSGSIWIMNFQSNGLVSSYAGNSMWWTQVTWNKLHVHMCRSNFCFSNVNKLHFTM